MHTLYLGWTPITNAGLAHLRSRKNLRVLYLSHTKSNDQTLAHLAPLKKLQQHYLADTAITDKGMAHLAALLELRVLPQDALKGLAVGSPFRRQDQWVLHHLLRRKAFHPEQGVAGRDQQAELFVEEVLVLQIRTARHVRVTGQYADIRLPPFHDPLQSRPGGDAEGHLA